MAAEPHVSATPDWRARFTDRLPSLLRGVATTSVFEQSMYCVDDVFINLVVSLVSSVLFSDIGGSAPPAMVDRIRQGVVEGVAGLVRQLAVLFPAGSGVNVVSVAALCEVLHTLCDDLFVLPECRLSAATWHDLGGWTVLLNHSGWSSESLNAPVTDMLDFHGFREDWFRSLPSLPVVLVPSVLPREASLVCGMPGCHNHRQDEGHRSCGMNGCPFPVTHVLARFPLVDRPSGLDTVRLPVSTFHRPDRRRRSATPRAVLSLSVSSLFRTYRLAEWDELCSRSLHSCLIYSPLSVQGTFRAWGPPEQLCRLSAALMASPDVAADVVPGCGLVERSVELLLTFCPHFICLPAGVL